jgi:hypothetical protein
MNLGFIDKQALDELLEKIKAIRNMLIGLIKSVNRVTSN